MKYAGVCSNAFGCDKKAQEEVLQYLRDGYAVHVSSDCNGHTRAWIVAREGIDFMIKNGAHKVEPDEDHAKGGPFYAL